MSRQFNPDLLVPDFWAKAQLALADLAAEGKIFVPYFGLRNGLEQARLWRQSRTTATINRTLETLRSARADYIADLLDLAGPSDGPWATNALPGQSWHQWGEGLDCYAVDRNGEADWNSMEPYRAFGTMGKAHGLTWGGDFGDNDHWQFRAMEPGNVWPGIKSLNDAFRARWAGALEFPV